MVVDPGIERRVYRLENETAAIYDLIRDETRDIRSTMGEHTRILGEHTRILGEHGRALAEILRRLPDPS